MLMVGRASATLGVGRPFEAAGTPAGDVPAAGRHGEIQLAGRGETPRRRPRRPPAFGPRSAVCSLHSALCILGFLLAVAPGWGAPEKSALRQALAKVQVPPDWFNGVSVRWDTGKPWKDARLEIRRLLGGDQASVREGMKLTYLYKQKGDIGDGHEYPMYLFMGGEYAWALLEYQKFVPAQQGKGATHAYQCLSSCYAHFGEYRKALDTLNAALNDLPKPPWQIASRANIEDALGDLYARMGNEDEAKNHYREAARLYPTSDQPWSRHLLHRQAAKSQNKLDLLTMRGIRPGQLRDGAYAAQALGYAGDVNVTVTVRAGKIAGVQVDHKEKIDLDAAEIIPRRIIAAQSVRVDAVTGATVTSHAIMDGVYEALKKSGLR